MLLVKIKKLFICAVILSASSISLADKASHEAAAEALLNSMNMDGILEESVDVILNMKLQQQPSMIPYKATMKEFFSNYMSGESLKGDFIRLYTETFTEKELIEITDFYLTPTGQKTIATSTDLMEKGAAIGQQRIMENISELQYMIEQEATRITELQELN
jgi:uncharacterized protein